MAPARPGVEVKGEEKYTMNTVHTTPRPVERGAVDITEQRVIASVEQCQPPEQVGRNAMDISHRGRNLGPEALTSYAHQCQPRLGTVGVTRITLPQSCWDRDHPGPGPSIPMTSGAAVLKARQCHGVMPTFARHYVTQYGVPRPGRTGRSGRGTAGYRQARVVRGRMVPDHPGPAVVPASA